MNANSRGLPARLVEELGAAIAGGDKAPGDRLDVEDLERRYGVSRTVVRDAIRTLSTKGLVDARPKRGTYVLGRERWNALDPDVVRWRYSTRRDDRFLEDLNEVRDMIEPAAARLAASRRTDADIGELRDALADMNQAGDDLEAAVTADLRFHRALNAAAHNEILGHLGVVLEAGLRARDLFVMGNKADADVPSHSAVVDAIEAADPDGAEARMHSLVERSLEAAKRQA